MNTPTPRTDEWEAYYDECYYHMWRLRRKTERAWNDEFHIYTEDEAKGLCDLLNNLEAKLTAVTEQRDEAQEDAERWKSSSNALECAGEEQARRADENREWALKAERERDEARGQRDAYKKAWYEMHSSFERSRDEVEKMTEQRDRLAEALERIANNNIQDTPETDYAYALGRMEGIAKIALQSLKQDHFPDVGNMIGITTTEP